MVKRGARPCRCRMARFACDGIARSPVVGIRRTVVVGRVAGITSAVRQCVVAVRVARLTGRSDMQAREWEFRRAVIEGGRLPGCGRVACLAHLTEIPRDMIWIEGTRKISGVALVAIRVDELIVAICMARCTGCGYVRTRQCEPGGVVVEGRGRPRGRRMTRLAGLTEAAGHMVRVPAPLEIGRMTLITIVICKLVVAVGMTCLTRD
jgi:hypothetical protein